MTFELIFFIMILLVIAVWIFIGFALWSTPIIIACIRRHKNILAISIMTLFLGWIPIGWLAAVLWSLNSDVKDKELDE